MAEEFVKTGSVRSNLEAANAGAFNPDYGYTPHVQNQYNFTTMNTVSIQCLAVDCRSLTYFVVLQNSDAAWLAPTPRKLNSSFLSACAYATQSPHGFGHHRVAGERYTVGREPSPSNPFSARATACEWDSPSYNRIPDFTPSTGFLCSWFRGRGAASTVSGLEFRTRPIRPSGNSVHP